MHLGDVRQKKCFEFISAHTAVRAQPELPLHFSCLLMFKIIEGFCVLRLGELQGQCLFVFFSIRVVSAKGRKSVWHNENLSQIINRDFEKDVHIL